MAIDSGKDAVGESLQTTSSVKDTVDKVDNAQPVQVLTRAVVVEVMYDLAAFPPDDVNELMSLCSAPDLLKTAPRNSIIARPITGGADKRAPEAKEKPTEEEKEKSKTDKEPVPEKEKVGEQGVLAYPFFPPHLCMPLKPGEQVWLVSDSPDVPNSVMYWMCRISEPDHVDDVNFTHGDRKLVGSLAPKTSKEKADAAEKSGEAASEPPPRSNGGGSQSQQISDPNPPQDATGEAESETVERDADGDGIDDLVYGFPNGTGEPDGYTLKEAEAYEDLVKIATGYNQFRPQDVPRYTKRPGDLVLQGSNNTLICLGEERGWKKDDNLEGIVVSNATETEQLIEQRKNNVWGSIDIVAGRGRYNWRFLGADPKDDPIAPGARTITNTPNPEGGRVPYVETNKNPQASSSSESNMYDNPAEGDPDYFGDAARIIVAHSSDVDTNFTIDGPGNTLPSPIGETYGSYDLVNKSGDNPSYVISKADEIRIVARKVAADEPSPGAPEINGSIRIIKEGAPDEDLAAIMILSDGTVQISGSRIVMGRTPDDGGHPGETEGPGENQSQPYVRYSDLEKLWQDWMDAMSSFCQTLQTHTTPGYGAPSPQINSAAAVLKGEIERTLKKQIEDVQSERIFGE